MRGELRSCSGLARRSVAWNSSRRESDLTIWPRRRGKKCKLCSRPWGRNLPLNFVPTISFKPIKELFFPVLFLLKTFQRRIILTNVRLDWLHERPGAGVARSHHQVWEAPPRTGVKCSIKCSCRSRGFLQSGGKSERFLNVFLFINFSYDIDNKLEVVAQISKTFWRLVEKMLVNGVLLTGEISPPSITFQ